MYVIPFSAKDESETIEVSGTAGVAEYFLTSDAASARFRFAWAALSDPILNLLLFGYPKSAFLNWIFRKLEDGMDSSFCWGDEGFRRRYFHGGI